MQNTIQNNSLLVSIKSKGAELFSIVNKEAALEYMWSGDPAFWGKTSPILFPIVGTLKGDTYLFKDGRYHLSRHGFARDEEFAVIEADEDRVTFALVSSDATLEKFPFAFRLEVRYQVVGNSLSVTYNVRHDSKEVMLFSIGGHPAFRVPLVQGTRYEDYFLKFEKVENAPRWPISTDGLIMTNPVPLLNHTDTLPLSRALFYQDALVFKHLQSNTVSIRSLSHNHGLDFSFEGFPFLGIWAAKDADFVCLEPWCGVADSVTHNQRLEAKEGIEKVGPGEEWTRTWRVRLL